MSRIYNLQLFAEEEKTEPASPKKREDLRKRDIPLRAMILLWVLHY